MSLEMYLIGSIGGLISGFLIGILFYRHYILGIPWVKN